MQRGGRGGGGFRGGGRSFGGGGRGGGRSFGGGRGGGRGFQDYGPPSEVVAAGIFEHPCEGEAVCKLSIDKVSCFAQGLQCSSSQHEWYSLYKLKSALSDTNGCCGEGANSIAECTAGSLLQCTHVSRKQNTDRANRGDFWRHHQHCKLLVKIMTCRLFFSIAPGSPCMHASSFC